VDSFPVCLFRVSCPHPVWLSGFSCLLILSVLLSYFLSLNRFCNSRVSLLIFLSVPLVPLVSSSCLSLWFYLVSSSCLSLSCLLSPLILTVSLVLSCLLILSVSLVLSCLIILSVSLELPVSSSCLYLSGFLSLSHPRTIDYLFFSSCLSLIAYVSFCSYSVSCLLILSGSPELPVSHPHLFTFFSFHPVCLLWLTFISVHLVFLVSSSCLALWFFLYPKLLCLSCIHRLLILPVSLVFLFSYPVCPLSCSLSLNCFCDSPVSLLLFLSVTLILPCLIILCDSLKLPVS